MSSVKHYKIAPISKDVFTMAEVFNNPMNNQKLELVPGAPVQNVNLATLNETGLHRALYILKNRLDPAKLGSAEETWRRLPDSKGVAFDMQLHVAYPETILRALLQKFMETWARETLERRSLGEGGANGIQKDKFKSIPGWPALHSVKPSSVSDSQLVMTQRGVQIQPEQCVAKLGELRNKINELSASLQNCGDVACFQNVSKDFSDFQQTESQSKCLTPFKN